MSQTDRRTDRQTDIQADREVIWRLSQAGTSQTDREVKWRLEQALARYVTDRQTDGLIER